MTKNSSCIIHNVEAEMRKASILVSLAALVLMGYGYIDALTEGGSFVLPGDTAVPANILMHLKTARLSLVLMSGGIILLAALPALRVVLALWFYVRRHDGLDAVVTLVVFLELLLSMHLGR